MGRLVDGLPGPVALEMRQEPCPHVAGADQHPALATEEAVAPEHTGPERRDRGELEGSGLLGREPHAPKA